MITFLKAFAVAALIFSPALILNAEDPAPATPKPYPLDVCVVSDEKLGGMGDPYKFTHEGQEIKLCCEYCKPKFDKEPAKYLKKLEGK